MLKHLLNKFLLMLPLLLIAQLSYANSCGNAYEKASDMAYNNQYKQAKITLQPAMEAGLCDQHVPAIILYGTVHQKMNQCDLGVKYFEAAVKLQPFALGYMNLGACHHDNRDYKQAIEALEIGMDLADKDKQMDAKLKYNAVLSYIEVQSKQKKLQPKIFEYLNVITKEMPNFSHPHYLLGVYYEFENREMAKKEYEIACKLKDRKACSNFKRITKPDCDDAYQEAKALFKDGQFEKAELTLKKPLHKFCARAKHIEAFVLFSDINQVLGKHQQSISALKRASNFDKYNGEYYYTIAQILSKQDKSIRTIKSSLKSSCKRHYQKACLELEQEIYQ